MRLLLDANALLWWVTASARLTQTARNAIADPANEIAVGIGSLWELAIKRALRKLDFPHDFETVLRDEGFALLPIGYLHLRALEGLPFHHSDPFDRLLIAQATAEQIPIVTSDKSFPRYDIRVIW
ncbi:MAG TPA: type II toxin-antitoxin system VapC family toxin [Stellaceae bacterium]|jgi:PIN domain nuclease of toxin-antitoxin system|nr:type II toxin-antitoxin system VapC family toxin [Stellaceae bacterium]